MRYYLEYNPYVKCNTIYPTDEAISRPRGWRILKRAFTFHISNYREIYANRYYLVGFEDKRLIIVCNRNLSGGCMWAWVGQHIKLAVAPGKCYFHVKRRQTYGERRMIPAHASIWGLLRWARRQEWSYEKASAKMPSSQRQILFLPNKIRVGYRRFSSIPRQRVLQLLEKRGFILRDVSATRAGIVWSVGCPERSVTLKPVK